MAIVISERAREIATKCLGITRKATKGRYAIEDMSKLIAELEAEVARLTDATKRAIAERDDYWNLAEKRRFENETLKDRVAALREPLTFYVEADKTKRTLMDDQGRPQDVNYNKACKVLRETKA